MVCPCQGKTKVTSRTRICTDRWTERVIPIYPLVRFDLGVLEKNWHAKLKIRKKENILQNIRKKLPHPHPPLKTHVHLKLTKNRKIIYYQNKQNQYWNLTWYWSTGEHVLGQAGIGQYHIPGSISGARSKPECNSHIYDIYTYKHFTTIVGLGALSFKTQPWHI